MPCTVIDFTTFIAEAFLESPETKADANLPHIAPIPGITTDVIMRSFCLACRLPSSVRWPHAYWSFLIGSLVFPGIRSTRLLSIAVIGPIVDHIVLRVYLTDRRLSPIQWYTYCTQYPHNMASLIHDIRRYRDSAGIEMIVSWLCCQTGSVSQTHWWMASYRWWMPSYYYGGWLRDVAGESLINGRNRFTDGCYCLRRYHEVYCWRNWRVSNLTEDLQADWGRALT